MTREHGSRDRERVRRACLESARAAYEDAGLRGLCAAGRWEAALAAIRGADPETPSGEVAGREQVDEPP